MNEVHNILMVGVGGQGIILASDILSHAAMLSGYDVKKSEIHGMSQRGGSVFSHIRYGEQVFSPVIPDGEAHVLLSLEEMETLRWLATAKRDTHFIVSKTRILPANAQEYPPNIETHLREAYHSVTFIDPDSVTGMTGDKRFLNVALLGVISSFTALKDDAWKEAIGELVPKGTADGNWNAFLIGKNLTKKEAPA